MEVNISTNGTGILCALEGRLDTLAAQQVSKDIQPLLDQAEKEITLDCGKLEYISSSGLRIFLTLRKESAKKGGKIVILNLREEIKQVFLMTGFYNLFDIQDA